MPHDAGRTDRAQDYVLGRMSEAERERAERDLQLDPTFRDAVIDLAQRMRLLEHHGPLPGATRWNEIATRLADLPQMRPVLNGDLLAAGSKRKDEQGPFFRAVRAVSFKGALAVAIGFVCAFVLGYVAGKWM